MDCCLDCFEGKKNHPKIDSENKIDYDCNYQFTEYEEVSDCYKAGMRELYLDDES